MVPGLISFDPFYREAGAGSRNAEEDWLDQNSTASENQWSTAATTFYVSDAPPHKQRQYKELYEVHNGRGERDRRGTIRRSYIMNDVETFCTVLELSAHERERVVEIVEDIDLSSNNFGGKPYEKVLLAICSLVSDEHLSEGLGTADAERADERIVLRDGFKELMKVNDLSSREHNRIRQMLREKTNHF